MITNEYRPKYLRQVYGQKLPVSVLKAIALNPETSPRTIILEGEYGTGKTSCARAFARALNCTSKLKDGDACGICEHCKQDISKSIYYAEYDSSIIGNITDLKELKDTFTFNSDLGYKVIVLDEAHLISPQAQATLLKLLEEGTDGIFFVLCTTNISKILDTIQSRSLILNFSLIDDKSILDNLRNISTQMGLEIDDNVLNLIIERSRGHLRDAHMLLEQYKLLSRDDFMALLKSSKELYIMLLLASSVKYDKIIPTIINNLLHYRLSDLKTDYESFVLDMIKYLNGIKQTDNKDINKIIQIYKIKKNSLIDVLNDYRNYDMFNSDIRFESLMWLLVQKIKEI
jgi:DNA polymerase-3 subunit gamma/tau